MLESTADDLGALICRCANADRAAFRSLYDRMSPRLYGIALRLTRQPAVAADVVHDTFLQIWQNAARFDAARGSAEAWLGTMLRNRAIDAKRRAPREQVADDVDVPELVDESPDALARLLQNDDVRALRACMDALAPKQREAVMLAFFEGKSHAQLAVQLAAPIGTVHSTIRRALLSLRSCLSAGVPS